MISKLLQVGGLIVKQFGKIMFFLFIFSSIIFICISSGNTFFRAEKTEDSEDSRIESCIWEPEDIADNTVNDSGNPPINITEKNRARLSENTDRQDFNNVLFIGDSLTVGLQLYGGISDADYFCITGIGTEGIRNLDMNGIMLDEMLDSKQYSAIYIMLGINDMGMNRENYLSSYMSLLNHIREKQSDAYIIIQSILVVTASYTNSHPIFNNDEVRIRNKALSEFADDNHIFYLELNDYFADVNGNLYDYMSSDGCHLYCESYSIWSDVLLKYRP